MGSENQITLVINTLNEEGNITDCIRSASDYVDEILVCDMYSDDRTVEFAQELGAKIVYHDRTGFVEPARYYAISQASHEWVLVLDADERMTQKLGNRLLEIVKDDRVDLVMFGNLYLYFGDYVKHGGFFSIKWPRFFRRSIYIETYNNSDAKVHMNFMAIKKFAPRKLQLPSEYHIIHYAYPTIEKYVSKTIGMYARIEGEEYYSAGRKYSLLKLIYEPIKEFIIRYFFYFGFLDGIRGFILNVLYAVFRFAVWSNVWLLEKQAIQKKREAEEANPIVATTPSSERE